MFKKFSINYFIDFEYFEKKIAAKIQFQICTNIISYHFEIHLDMSQNKSCHSIKNNE